MIKIANNTTPKQRQKSATNAVASSEIKRNHPSSISIERSSRRLRVIATKVVAIFLTDEIKPSSTALNLSVNSS
jgi:hypothetical protein